MPRQPQEPRRARAAGHNLFLVVALFIVGFVALAAVGTFAYDRYLTHTLEAKAEELAAAQRAVNQEQVEEFIRLRDRLEHGQILLENHLAVTQLLDVLETQTLQTVRYGSLELAVAEDHTAQLEIEGTARTFNALAAQSNALAAEKGIRRAIFSGIVVNENGSVNFRLTADLDSRLLIADISEGSPAAAVPAEPVSAEPMPAEIDTTL